MALFDKILTAAGLAAAGFMAGKLIEGIGEEKRRKNTPFHFPDNIKQSDFNHLVEFSAKHIKRLTNIYVDGHNVYGTVRSQSGISNWEFRLDFNDYGILSGKYWCYSRNTDSTIPNRLGDKIKDGLGDLLKSIC